MLYSQHILGIGHFFRSMEIARALHGHEVMFVEGGDPLLGFNPPAHVSRFLLPPLMMDAEFKAMEVRQGSLEDIKTARAKLLMEAFRDFAPQAFMTELFPFGRRQFRFELMPILQMIRENRMPVRVVCSLRDILVEKTNQAAYEKWVLDLLNTYYDLLLVHSDPRLITLEETFTQVDKIRVPGHYTGFVTRPLPVVQKEPGQKVIVASSGGGKVGVDLLASAILAVQSLPDPNLLLKVFVGPFMEAADQEFLQQFAARDLRTTLLPFSPDFLAELMAAELSISMAGYNTCMDILNTGVKAIVFPFPQNREQTLRAKKLESLGLVKMLGSLSGEKLSETIDETLKAAWLPFHGPSLDLAGAVRTAHFIEGLFGAEC
jgi:predicted glycosyltransferase